MTKSKPAVSASVSKRAGKVDRVSIEGTDNGGYIVTVSYQSNKSTGSNVSYVEPKRFTLASKKELQAQMDALLGEEKE